MPTNLCHNQRRWDNTPVLPCICAELCLSSSSTELVLKSSSPGTKNFPVFCPWPPLLELLALELLFPCPLAALSECIVYSPVVREDKTLVNLNCSAFQDYSPECALQPLAVSLEFKKEHRLINHNPELSTAQSPFLLYLTPPIPNRLGAERHLRSAPLGWRGETNRWCKPRRARHLHKKPHWLCPIKAGCETLLRFPGSPLLCTLSGLWEKHSRCSLTCMKADFSSHAGAFERLMSCYWSLALDSFFSCTEKII